MGEMADYVISCGFEDIEDYYWEDDLSYGIKEPFYPIRLDRGPGKCPKCGNELIIKDGKYGIFYGCPLFPKCKYARPYR